MHNKCSLCPSLLFGEHISHQLLGISLLIAHSCIPHWELFLALGSRLIQNQPPLGKPKTPWCRDTSFTPHFGSEPFTKALPAPTLPRDWGCSCKCIWGQMLSCKGETPPLISLQDHLLREHSHSYSAGSSQSVFPGDPKGQDIFIKILQRRESQRLNSRESDYRTLWCRYMSLLICPNP